MSALLNIDKPENDMDAETRAELIEHAKDIAVFKRRLNDHDQMIEELRDNDIKIMTTLGQSATHEDIQAVNGKIDAAVNGLLRDALNAVPEKAANQIAKQGNMWLAVAAIVALCALIAAIVTNHA